MPTRSHPPAPRSPAAVHLQDSEDERPERHRRANQEKAERELLVYGAVHHFVEKDPHVVRIEIEGVRRQQSGRLHHEDHCELEERERHPHLGYGEPGATAS